MSISDQVRALTEDIETSYDTRIAAVSDIVTEAHQTLRNFKQEREKMAGDLKRSLASNRSDRAKQVQKMRARHNRDAQATARAVEEFLSASEEARTQEFAALIAEVKGQVAMIEEDTAQLLADFRSGHHEMAQALRTSLAGETSERIEEVHAMLARFTEEHQEMASSLRNELSTFQSSLTQAVDEMLAAFSADHQQAHAHWEHLTEMLTAKKARKSASSPKAESSAPAQGKEKRTNLSKTEG